MTNEARAQVLIEALPYIREFRGKTLVIKYGGAAMVDEDLKASVMQDLVLMHTVGLRPILVHGGGPEVSRAMKKAGKAPVFHNGLRVTDSETMEIVEMVLTGRTNTGIVTLIHRAGGKAVGLSGKDGNLLVATKLESAGADLGFVGEVAQINTEILQVLTDAGYIPVISSVAVGSAGETFNINADHVAGRLAGELKAEKLVIMTDIRGILRDVDDPDSLLSEISGDQARELMEEGIVASGMIPKVEACLIALDAGVQRTHIIDGRVQHSLLTEVFTDGGYGTMISPL